MGLLSWWKGSSTPTAKPITSSHNKTEAAPKLEQQQRQPAVPGMNGAIEVPRSDITVFEFGSVAATADKVTLAGYCPVSDALEPCRWELLPATDSEAPQFRVVF